MTDISPFPLERLPAVPFHKFLTFLTFREQFYVSTVSLKTRNAVKSYFRRFTFHLKIIHPDKSFYMLTQFQNDKKIGSLVYCRFWEVLGDILVAVKYCQVTGINGYRINSKEVFKLFIEFYSDVFNPSISLDLGIRFDPFALETIEYISKFNVKKLALKQYLKNSNMILFLKTWIKGSKLGEFKAPCQESSFHSIFGEIDGEPVQRAKIDGRAVDFNNNECYLVRQVNGVEAIIYFCTQSARKSIVLTTNFELL